MKPKILCISIALACSALQAHAIGKLADVTVMDRESGATLPVHYYRGEYWVAGSPGARYSISIRNKGGDRILAVPAVDGVNVLSGQTAGWGQSGYVFSPYRQYAITGWRKSDSEVAAFEFSASANSYAERTGRPANVGVIGVALFREKLPEPVVQAPDYSRNLESSKAASRYSAPSMPAPATAATGRLSESSTSDAAPAPAHESRGSASNDSFAKAAPMPVPKLGTAHGNRETSVVSSTSFERQQAQPNEVIRIRYDSRENLIALGVIREPIARAPVLNAFPQSPSSTSYVPDPPRY
jgi:hypothetical protein